MSFVSGKPPVRPALPAVAPPLAVGASGSAAEHAAPHAGASNGTAHDGSHGTAHGAAPGAPREGARGTTRDGVRWTGASAQDEHDAQPAGYRAARAASWTAGAAASAASPAGAAGGPGAAWRAHVDALARWCRSDWPLSHTGHASAALLALALGVRLGTPGSGNGRGALGEVVRLALAAAQADVATLRAALDDHAAPAARALLARVLGASWLLGAVRLRGASVVGTELRACTSREEGAAMLATLFGHLPSPDGGALPALRALGTGWVRGARRDGPLLGEHAAAAPLAADEELVLVLPLLALDGRVPAEPPAAILPAVVPAPAPSPFLAGDDPRAIGAFPGPLVGEGDGDDDDEEDGSDDEPGPDDADARDGRAGRHAGRHAEQEADDEGDGDGDGDGAHGDAAEDADADAGVRTPARADAPPRAATPPAPLDAAPTAPTARATPTAVAEPEPPADADAMAAALERLRRRARERADRVEATVASDDGVVEAVVDVARWLAQATPRELRDLARAGWAGDEAVEVARALADEEPEIVEVARHARRTEGELVVEIDARAASAWLRAHRPDAAEELEELLD